MEGIKTLFIIDTDKVKCKFCLEILQKEEVAKNTNICDECKSLINQVPDLLNKMDQHIRIINKFVTKYKPNEVNLEEALLFLENDYIHNHDLELTSDHIDNLYSEMAKYSIKISGKMLLAAFIPRVVEIVRYSTLKKVHQITKATDYEKEYLRDYWLEHYSYILPDDFTHIIHLSFIHRKKTGYEEKFYDFPSCVIDKMYTLYAEKTIPETFYKVLTPEEFFAMYKNYSLIIDLQKLQMLDINRNLENSLENSTLLGILSATQDEVDDDFEDWDQRRSRWRPISYDYYFYSKKENLFLIITYYELELLVIKSLIHYVEVNAKVPSSIDIVLVQRKRKPNYLKVFINGFFDSKYFAIYENNYGIDIYSFYEQIRNL